MTVRGTETWITGSQGMAKITDHTTSGHVFYFDGNGSPHSRNGLTHVWISGGAVKTVGYAVNLNWQDSFHLQDVYMSATGNCIQALFSSSVYLDQFECTALAATTGVGVRVEGGQDLFINNGGISSTFASQSFCGIQIAQTAGLWIDSTDVFATGNGLCLNPTTDKIDQNLFISNSSFDSNTGDGIAITPDGTGIVRSVYFTGSWAASNTLKGIRVAVQSGSAIIQGISFDHQRSILNAQDGIYIGAINTSDVIITGGSTIAGNNSSVGAYHGISIEAGASAWRIQNSQIGPYDGQPDTQVYNINIASGASTNFEITGNSVTGGTSGMINNLSTGAVQVISSNIPIDATVPAVASNATLAFPLSPSFTITGTTGVTAVSKLWAGRIGTLRTTDGAVVFTAGATIGNTITTTQNTLYTYEFDGTKIWIK